MTTKKWLDSIEKQKRRIDLKEQRDIHTYIQTDRQSQRQKIIDSLARHGVDKLLNRDERSCQLSHVYDRLFAATSSNEWKLTFWRRRQTAVVKTSVENIEGCLLTNDTVMLRMLLSCVWYSNIPEHDRIVSLRGSIIDYSYGSGSSSSPAVLLIMDRYKCDLYAAIERRMNRLARYTNIYIRSMLSEWVSGRGLMSHSARNWSVQRRGSSGQGLMSHSGRNWSVRRWGYAYMLSRESPRNVQLGLTVEKLSG